jgi:hypothetical protein
MSVHTRLARHALVALQGSGQLLLRFNGAVERDPAIDAWLK